MPRPSVGRARSAAALLGIFALALVVTVGVAWIGAEWEPTSQSPRHVVSTRDSQPAARGTVKGGLLRTEWDAYPVQPGYIIDGEVEVPSWVGLPAQGIDALVRTDACGFPRRCLAEQIHIDFSTRPATYRVIGAWVIRKGQRPFFLPITVIWPGLLANIAFWSLALAAAWYGLGAARRALRLRRGACIRCGYSRSGLAVGDPCPECGAIEGPAAATSAGA